MDIQTLKHFQYIAKYKNITKAAKHFFISQSTLSRQMMALEEELGVTLFIRDNKKLELTKAGEVFTKECNLLVDHMEVVVKNTMSAGLGKSGIIRIAAPGNISPILPEALYRLRKLYPNVQLIIEEYDFNDITSAILYNIYDVGFTYQFAAPDAEDIVSEVIDEDDFSLVVSSSVVKEVSPESIRKVVTKLPMILPSYAEPPFIKLVEYSC